MPDSDMDRAQISFRRLEETDLPLMHKWLNQGDVLQWYSKGQATLEDLRKTYLPRIEGSQPTECFVMLLDGISIGHIQTYKIRDYPDYYAALGIDEHAAGLDLFIGEPEYLHKGLGSRIIRQFAEEVVFGESDSVSCIAGPDPANKASIRAFEKAGFRHLKTVQVDADGPPEYLMRIAREDITNTLR